MTVPTAEKPKSTATRPIEWIIRALIAVLILALALTAKRWGPPALEFLRVKGELLQSLQSLLQIVLWLAEAVYLYFSVQHLRSAASHRPGAPTTITGVAIGGGEHNRYDVTVSTSPASAPPAPAPDLDAAAETYRQFVRDRYRYLDFRGMGVSDRVPLRLALQDMYVPLKARCELPEHEAWQREAAAKRPRGDDREALDRARSADPVPMCDLWESNPGLVILGDPGSGKTTFLKHEALRLINDSSLLPFLLPLSAYATVLASHDVPLDDFAAGYLEELGLDIPVRALLRDALRDGRAVVMLDGLDEVKDAALRATVVRRVEDFYTLHRRAGSKFLLTSRIIGYRQVRPNVEGLQECTLVDFSEEEIEDFVTRWTQAVERAARDQGSRVAEQEAARERDELLEAIGRSPGVRLLASNPLLLTILALMKRQGVQLPERRVELYQKYVEVLLSSWNLARGLGRPPARDLDVKETLKVLAPLALWMHEVSPGVGLVSEFDLQQKLQTIYADRGETDPAASARRLLDDVHEWAGLLVERGPGQYGFIHLTFEEYLAAVALAQLGEQDVTPVAEALAARVGDQAWREPSLLAVGYLGVVQNREGAAAKVVENLLSRADGPLVVLAGDAVADAGPGSVTPSARTHAAEALQRTMRDPGAVATVRASAGRTLARLGDTRPGVGLNADGFPDLLWRDIPAGPFTMGSAEGEENSYDDERPCDLPYYRISTYPVTVAQFQAFVQARGYTQREWWTAAGWKWRCDGNVTAPQDPGLPFSLPNHPVVNVSWYEALAFTRWLTAQRRDPDGWIADLPSEAEWEKAARGDSDARPRPWLGPLDPERADYDATGIGSTSAVGCFPAGVSPCGVEECLGNVWEWTRSRTKDYPYRAGDGQEEVESEEARVLRGGSWINGLPDGLRVACRIRYHPTGSTRNLGFRCVLRRPGL